MTGPTAEPPLGGLLDPAARALAAVDGWWGQALPPTARVAVWALLCAALSMAVYRLLSPRRRVRSLKTEAAAARRRLARYDGELSGALPLMAEQIGTALRVVAAMLPATAAAMAPVLTLTLWLDSAYTTWELPFFGVFFAATLALRRVMDVE